MAEKKLQLVIGINSNAFKEGLAGINKDLKDSQKEWKRDFAALNQSMKDTGKQLMAIGGAITGFAALSVTKFNEVGEEISYLSEQTGFSSEAISTLKYTAERTGASIETLKTAIRGAALTLEEARNSTTKTTKGLDTLGIEFKDLKDLSPEQQFMKLANAVASIQDPMQKVALAQDIFGKSGMDLIPILNLGEQGMADMAAEAKRLGIVYDSDMIRKGKEVEDALDGIKGAVDGLMITIGTALTPIVKSLSEKIVNITIAFKDWSKGNENIIQTIAKIGVALVGAGGLIYAIATVTQSLNVLIASPAGLILLAAAAVTIGIAWLTLNKILETTEEKIAKITREEVELRKLNEEPAKQYAGMSEFATAYVNEQEKTDIEVRAAVYQETVKKETAWLKMMDEKATDTLKTELDERKKLTDKYWDDLLKNIQEGMELQEEANNKAIDGIDEIYGVDSKTSRNRRAMAEDAHDTAIGLIDEEIRKQEELTAATIKGLNDAYNEKVRLLNRANELLIDGLDDQIDAIDAAETAAERLAQDEERAAEKSKLVQNIATTGGNQAAWDALNKYEAETAEILAKRKRADDKLTLQQQKENIKEAEDAQIYAWGNELTAKIAKENEVLRVKTENLAIEKTQLDQALTEALNRIEAERLAALAAQAEIHAARMNNLLLEQQTAAATAIGAELPEQIPFTPIESGVNSGVHLATGGIVSRPTHAFIGESGPEAVIPLDKPIGTTVNINGGNFLGNEADARKWARVIIDYVRENNRIQTSGRLA